MKDMDHSKMDMKDPERVYFVSIKWQEAPIMSKQAVFTMKLEPELRAEFMAEAEAAHRPASQVLRELMREFVQRQRESREYDEFLRRKVEAGRASMRAGLGRIAGGDSSSTSDCASTSPLIPSSSRDWR